MNTAIFLLLLCSAYVDICCRRQYGIFLSSCSVWSVLTLAALSLTSIRISHTITMGMVVQTADLD